MSPDAITVLIADDHPLFREGIRSLLTRDGRFVVVSEAARGDEALRKLVESPPRIALLDHQMPGLSGLEVIREVRKLGLSTRSGLLTSFGKAALVAEAAQVFSAAALGPEGVEGTMAFIQKRKAKWVPQ